MPNSSNWPYSAPRKNASGDLSEPSTLDESMISAVSDFSGLDGIMAAHEESAPVVTRFSHIPEFPELLPEVRAELLEIQAAMDSARALREAEANAGSAVLADEVSDEVDKIIAAPFGETVDTESPPQVSAVRESRSEVLFPADVPAALSVQPDDEAELSHTPPVADAVRGIQFKALRSEVFQILSSDDDFPAYHVKIILDLSWRIAVWTPESELSDIGTLLLYLSETLWVFFDREGQWEDHKNSYVSSALRSPKTKFRLRALRLISASDAEKETDDPETLRIAKSSFDRDYERWHQRFSSLLKRNGAQSITAFRTDFASKPYWSAAEKCLEAGFALWKDVFLENRRIQAELTKIRWGALLRKIRRIEKEFDFSDIERLEDLEAARKWTYRPKKRKKNVTGDTTAFNTIPQSDWSA